MKLSELHPFHTFRPHPFKVKDDAKMQETVASIKANGVMVPGLARPEKDGGGYEIVAGHRRCRGSELAGLEEMPFIVRDMTDQEAVQAMRDSNKQRDQTLPSELAALLDLEVEAIKHQGGRLDGVAPGDVGKRSVEIVGEAHDMNYKKVMRYLRLNSLVPELLNMVDEKKLGFMPAVELSYIKPRGNGAPVCKQPQSSGNPGQHLRRHLPSGNYPASKGLCGFVGTAVRPAQKVIRCCGAIIKGSGLAPLPGCRHF